jgi:mannose-6-phosphate isomerase-like protein (cupin superfamily)
MHATRNAVTVIAPDAGERLDVFGAPMIVKTDGGPLGFYLAEHPIPPGYFVPLHVHDEDDEAFYIVRGELTLMTAKGESTAGPGSLILLPRGEAHGFRNDTDYTVIFLSVCRPGVQAIEMFRHYDRARRAAAAALPPSEIAAIANEYGVQMA